MNEENNSVRKRNLKVYYWHSEELNCFPLIRLRGKYLLDNGFNVGDIIEVSIGAGEISIKKVGKPPEQMKPDPP